MDGSTGRIVNEGFAVEFFQDHVVATRGETGITIGLVRGEHHRGASFQEQVTDSTFRFVLREGRRKLRSFVARFQARPFAPRGEESWFSPAFISPYRPSAEPPRNRRVTEVP
jgi:hypothetical protein